MEDELIDRSSSDQPALFKDTESQIVLVSKDIEEIIQYKTQGALIRCKANWLEGGEKSTIF